MVRRFFLFLVFVVASCKQPPSELVLHSFADDPFMSDAGWYHKFSGQTVASVNYVEKAIRIDVERFDRAKASPKYFATVNCTENIPDAKHYRYISAKVRGSLRAIRFYLENPGKSRLRSAKCPVKKTWSTCRIAIADMGAQKRERKKPKLWHDVNENVGTSFKRFSMKLGRNINPYNARGHVEIGPVTFSK